MKWASGIINIKLCIFVMIWKKNVLIFVYLKKKWHEKMFQFHPEVHRLTNSIIYDVDRVYEI